MKLACILVIDVVSRNRIMLFLILDLMCRSWIIVFGDCESYQVFGLIAINSNNDLCALDDVLIEIEGNNDLHALVLYCVEMIGVHVCYFIYDNGRWKCRGSVVMY